MTNPTVCAIMLTRDRPDYARRAVECYRAQTYENKRMLIYNTNTAVEYGHIPEIPGVNLGGGVMEVPAGFRGLTIGAMRNEAMKHADYDVIIHWDDDDWSHPNRIAEQVSLLESSGKDCVGYRELLFWEEAPSYYGKDFVGVRFSPVRDHSKEGAWLYSNGDIRTCLGTSLCYWRKAWEQNPFSEKNGANPRQRGEDREFVRKVKSQGVSGFGDGDGSDEEPRMIARIHVGNAHHYIERTAPWWTRAPEWDKHCAEVMG